jgi:hypothetical protein
MFNHYEWQYYWERHQYLLEVAAEARLAQMAPREVKRRLALWQRVNLFLCRLTKECAHNYAVERPLSQSKMIPKS